MSERVDSPLPEGWIKRTSARTGITFYVNRHTKKGQWHRPLVKAPMPNGRFPDADEIRCCHILVKHSESRRPSSWRNESIERTKDEAIETIKNFRQQILSGEAKFEDIAKIYSDCTSARHHGDLGHFRKGQMQQAFEAVAFKLKVGQLSRPVESHSGIHLILRTA